MNVSAAKTIKTIYFLFVIAAFTSFLSSCVTHYPNKPFVYHYNINILPKGAYPAEEQKILKDQLDQQLHDSIRVRKERKFLVVKVLDKPPVFDSINMSTSQRYMRNMLHTLGYLRDSIHPGYTIDTVKDQQRVTVNFDVMPGKLFRVDSMWYDLTDSVPRMPEIDTLQMLTAASLGDGVIKKGDPFSQYLISSELDRIADLARNNGYLKFGKEQLLAVWDTVGRSILTATTDITEQIRQLEELRRRRENPTTDLQFRLRGNIDTSRLTRYYVGEVRIYPDTDIDTTANNPLSKKVEILTRNQYKFISYRNQFRSRKLIPFITPYLRRGELYSQTNHRKAESRFNNLPAWRLSTVNPIARPGTDSVDFDILLVPAAQYNASINFDVSRNQGNITAEGLLGLGANLTLVNRNFGKAANLVTTNFRYGVELATSKIDSIQTQQFSISNTIRFPRLVPRTRLISQEWRELAQTFLTTNLSHTDRIDYFRVFTLNTSWGYDFTHKNSIIGIRWPNIEYNFLERRDSLIKLIDSNQSYKYIFGDGMILSAIINWSNITSQKNLTTTKRASIELSSFPGFLHSLFPNVKQYRFVKFDGELSQIHKVGPRRRSALAWRAFGGIGYGLPFSTADGRRDSTNLFMPFFRQYYAGGPSSMRAWALRKLGPGTTIKSFDKTIAPDRFGDMRLEFNLEWRIYLTQLLGSYALETVLFTDIGNVWFVRKNDDFPDGEFDINRLGKDLAVGVGTGIRIDFGFLLARFDFAWKAKDPSPDNPATQNKWFYNTRPWIGNKTNTTSGVTKYGAQFQLGINYPF